MKTSVVAFIWVIRWIFRERYVHEMMRKIANSFQSKFWFISIKIEKDYLWVSFFFYFKIISYFNELWVVRRYLTIVHLKRRLRIICIALSSALLGIFEHNFMGKKTINSKTHWMHQVSQLSYYRLHSQNWHSHWVLFVLHHLINHKSHKICCRIFNCLMLGCLFDLWTWMNDILTNRLKKIQTTFDSLVKIFHHQVTAGHFALFKMFFHLASNSAKKS